MTQKHDFLIGGEWRGSARILPVVNPFNRQIVAEVCLAGAEEIEQAIALAEKAFKITKKLPAYLRARICLQIAEGIKKRADEFARTIALESGKPMIHARNEVARAVSTFEIAAEEAKRIHGDLLTLDIGESSRGKMGIARRFPVGPVSAISPFNFPLNLVAHKVAPAMACGNPVVLKPASATPLTALLLGKVITESEAVAGSFSVVPCKSSDASALTDDPRFKLLTFTGSPEIGWELKRHAGKKKVVLELGGNAAVVVEPDADLAAAAKKISVGAFAFSGQVCISVQRAYIHESCFRKTVEMILDETRKLKSGDPLDESVTFGPMIDEANAVRIESWVAQAVGEGAELLMGGERNGSYYPPSVLTRVGNASKLCCREAFGPILVVEPYSEFQSALRAVNDSDYGLQAGVFTNQLDKAMRAFNELEVGGVIINDVPTFRVDNMPYGGVKDSGFGREGVPYSIEEMTELKLLALNNYVD